MPSTVTFHDRIGKEQVEAAIEPMSVDQLHRLLEGAVNEATRITLGGTEVDLELTLCGDAEMTRLNFDHMGERGPTDVLAFPLHEWTIDGRHSHLADDDGAAPPGALLLGDLVVDVDQAVRQASEGGWSVAEEIVLLVVHGTLHLVGHDHAELDEEQEMRGAEHQVLGSLHRRFRDVDWKPGSLFDRAGHAVTSGS
ncbi:MAG TPA: rRNA maturation RNase YbeY [Candidatus Limnocylindria bacterium]|nr:rRNA maturation RNase YbeY [Candidatus Limnocylindria bacterium]